MSKYVKAGKVVKNPYEQIKINFVEQFHDNLKYNTKLMVCFRPNIVLIDN